MAEGALAHSHAHVAVSVTGIAGPDGGSVEKPVGLVWFGLSAGGRTTTDHAMLSPETARRSAVKRRRKR